MFPLRRLAPQGLTSALVEVGASLLAFSCATAAAAQSGAAPNRWAHYGGDAGSTKYSPLDQIERRNVGDLEVRWQWRSPDNDLGFENVAFEATPLYVDGRLYTSTSFSQAAAIDAGTGATLWVFDPRSYASGPVPNNGFLHRGVAYWQSANGAQQRVLYATGDARLFSLDAATGLPDAGFGSGGSVDLRQGIPRLGGVLYGMTSPPIIVGDRVIVGSSIHDGNNAPPAPPGDVRAFDVRTGALLWTFHTVPRAGEPGFETWGAGAANTAGHTNVWAPISADLQRELVYLPVSAPTNNYYGGFRPGNNLYANSLVCLDARTGQRVWHFQIVHHDIWDYDLGSAPNLMDVRIGGRNVPIVAQITKMGFVFAFDRRDGSPVWPIEERPVPASTVPGEQTSPTQPFPTKPPPFVRQGVSIDELVDGSPAEREAAIERINNYDWGELYTPPSERGTLLYPGIAGGGNWGGAGVDPETGVLFVTPVGSLPFVIGLDRRGSNLYIADRVDILTGPFGFHLFKPPWGKIVAYDMSRGTILWDRPNSGANGVAGHGAALVTRSLLFYANRSEARLRIFSKGNGNQVGSVALPARATGAPMTYQHEGRQHVVVAVGEGRQTMQLVALSLRGDLPQNPGELRFLSSATTLDEGAVSAEIALARLGGSDGEVSVALSANNGSATLGEDLTVDLAEVTWADGDATERRIGVEVIDDSLVEGPETLRIALETPTGGATLAEPSTHLLTIEDNDFPPCEPGAHTLCLQGTRFEVTATYRTPQGVAGSGTVSLLTSDTGYFTFFDEDNVELVVKVLDACSDFDGYWVFAAGLSDIEVALRVVDTASGTQRNYTSAQGMPFQPVADTGTFATCDRAPPH